MPLVFASLALGVVQLGRLDRLGPLAGRTFVLFTANMAIGVALGLLLMNLFRPGDALDGATKTRLLAEFGGRAKEAAVAQQSQPGISFALLVDMFLPRNFLKSVVEFQVLPVILFALLLGAAGTQLQPEARQRLQGALEMVAELMTRIVGYALLLAPVIVRLYTLNVHASDLGRQRELATQLLRLFMPQMDHLTAITRQRQHPGFSRLILAADDVVAEQGVTVRIRHAEQA